MPVELIAAWLLREAYKLVAVPVAANLQQRFDDKLTDEILAIPKRFFGQQPPADGDAAAIADEAEAGLEADTAFVEAIEEEPEAGAALRGTMEGLLGVNLDAEGASRGTPAWFVSAYDAILWRIAMLAAWEDRPIAIQGALQGSGWVTVCAPLKRGVIEPSTMWQRTDPRALRRNLHDRQPVDFFVRRITDPTQRTSELVTLNRKFTLAPNAAFKPTDGDSVAAGWHRIDGLNRAWVLLKPDAAAEKAIINKRSPLYEGQPLFPRSLDASPPEFDDYPDEWQPLLEIPSEANGIAALSAGADEFARASDASTAAVEAVLKPQP